MRPIIRAMPTVPPAAVPAMAVVLRAGAAASVVVGFGAVRTVVVE